MTDRTQAMVVPKPRIEVNGSPRGSKTMFQDFLWTTSGQVNRNFLIALSELITSEDQDELVADTFETIQTLQRRERGRNEITEQVIREIKDAMAGEHDSLVDDC